MSNANLKFFDGVVSHARVGKKKHHFNYKYLSAFIENVFDLKSNTFNRINSKLFSFDKKYTNLSGRVIEEIRRFLEKKNIKHSECQINLLRIPNIGFIKSFNPVCFWFLEANQICKFFIAEVKNTFHEDQIYIIENDGKNISQNIWLEVKKNMYVSPFAEKSGFYKFNISVNPFNIKIHQYNSEKKAEIITSLRGKISKSEEVNKLLFYYSLFLNSLLVLTRINLQAFLLWIKKFKIFPHGGSGYDN